MTSFGILNGVERDPFPSHIELNKERKVIGRKTKENKRKKHHYSNNFDTNSNLLPPSYLNKIITGDSLTKLKKLPDNCIDIVFTSPPYNFGLDYEKDDDTKFWEKYFSRLFDIFDECIRVLKHGGRFVINVQPLFSDYIPTHHIISQHLIARGLIWKGEILWEKNNYNCKYTAWGSWKSPSSPYLKYTWEFVEVFCKGSLKKEGSSTNADILGNDFKKWVYAKWSIAPERRMKEFGHPAVFPEELAKRVIQLFSYKGDIVLDPFNGVGTTTLVAHQYKRSYIGIDISAKYNRKARSRIKECL